LFKSEAIDYKNEHPAEVRQLADEGGGHFIIYIMILELIYVVKNQKLASGKMALAFGWLYFSPDYYHKLRHRIFNGQTSQSRPDYY